MTSSAASGAGPTAPPDETFDDSIDLRAYFVAIWTYRVWIVGCGVALALATWAIGARQTPEFEAQVALTITRSKLNTGAPEAPPTTATFRPLIENPSVAAKIIADLKLNEPPYSISPSQFFGSVVNIEEVRNSSVMILRTTLGDPALAARTANLLADLAVETTRRISDDEASQSQKDIQLQRDEAQERLRDAESALRAYREVSQVEALRRDVTSALQLRENLLPLTVDIEVNKARLAQAQKELAARPPTESVARTIDGDSALLEAARALGNNSSASSLLGLTTKNEYPNPVHETLDQLVAKTQADLAAMERQKSEIVDVRKLGAQRLSQLTRLYEAEAKLSQLETERKLATDVYVQVATAYETARLQVAGRSAQLQVIGPAVAPNQPIPRHLLRNTLGAFLIGVSVAAAAVLVYRAFA